jgi:hypothetical protein
LAAADPEIPAGAVPISIHLKAACVLKVRINDAGGYLERQHTDKTGPHVLVGVLSLGRFVPAFVTGQDKPASITPYESRATPHCRCESIAPMSSLQAPASAPVASQGYSSVIVQSSANPAPPPLVFTAVGRLP